MSNPNDYTVGWICAISTEYVAAQAFLDEVHDGPESVARHDNNDYMLGKIGKHNVVIAVLPDGEYGISSAATVARDMLHSFPNVRIGLMVGIAGGAPSRTHDIRLGDVVVSAPRDGKGGVFQYDFGKTIQEQSFRTTGFLSQPPQLLRAAVGGLRAQYELDGHGMEEAIDNILEKKPRLRRKYKRPDQSSDKLYKTVVVHPNSEGSCEAVCGNDPLSLESRRERAEHEDNPAIHYGLIASANHLMKDASIRDRLAAEKDVLCFEMEAAGLMNHFPCLVIRGICDYSDTHKNKEWQGYAAMAAAAYAKDLLCRITPNKVEDEKRMSGILSSVQEGVVKLVSVQHNHEHKAILDWLTPIDYASQYNDFIKRRQPGTGQWLIDSPQFQTWLDTSNQTLFCPGIPGAGKTMCASIVIEKLNTKFQNDTSVGTAYIYCNFRRKKEQKPADLLASLLKQFVQGLPSVPQSIQELYKQHKRTRTDPSCEEISQALQTIISKYDKAFIVIDALDEFQDSEAERIQFLAKLTGYQAKTGANLIVTSRFSTEIEKEFAGKSMKLEILASDEDLKKYIDGNIAKLPSFVRRNKGLQNEVKVAIIKAVKGMFLLAQLHLDSLFRKRSPKDLRGALERLPKGSDAYDKAYEKAMRRIKGQGSNAWERAKEVLLWITCAKRPLTALELQHALAIEVGESKLDEENLSDISDMVSICAGLVTVDETSGIVRLVHYTTQEYFERTQAKWFPDAATEITTACVTYLSFKTFESGYCLYNGEIKNRLQSNPLYEYAARYWGHYALEASTKVEELLVNFLRSDANVSASSQAMLDFVDHSRNSRSVLRGIRGVHLVANLGLEKVMATLLTSDIDPDCKDSNDQTPLSWAARNGHEAVIKLLLGIKKVDANSQDSSGRTPLLLAAENGHEAATMLLLNTKTVDVNLKDMWGWTPLSLAAQIGHKATTVLLLNTKTVDVNSKDMWGRTPLSWAAENGHKAITMLLLNTETVDVNLQDNHGSTPLIMAVQSDVEVWNLNEAVVKLLLSARKVDINLKDKHGRTALSCATLNGYTAVVKLLLDNSKVDVNLSDFSGQTPLLLAVLLAVKSGESGEIAVVKLLLDNRKVDITLTDDMGETPLSQAVYWENVAIVKLLLDALYARKVDVNPKLLNAALEVLGE